MHHHILTLAKVCENAGIKHAIICPGSRSAPLVYAFTQHTKITCYSIVDERSAAFVALGLAQQCNEPVIIIATSGTACLNFFPAVAEAYYQKIPLLILTADRPPEMLNQQDGQMIMQKGVYGKHVLGSHELLCFDENQSDFKLTERIVANAIDECQNGEKHGPVHINVPLREPLYDIPLNTKDFSYLNTEVEEIKQSIRKLPLLSEVSEAWMQAKKRIILIGQMTPNKQITSYLQKIVEADDVVVLSDIVSNQGAACFVPHFDSIIQFASEEVLNQLNPDFILSFGGPMVSKSLKNWLKKQKPSHHFRLQNESEIIDTYQNVTQAIIAEVAPYLDSFHSLNIFKNQDQKTYRAVWLEQEKKFNLSFQTFLQNRPWSEPKAMQQVINNLVPYTQVQLGNSSAVRWASWLGLQQSALSIFSNRGTSGIDGTISTAIGSAMAMPNQIVTLIVGDLSLFYDQNGFWQNNLPSNLKIIVLNNGNGNIFNWIDGPKKSPAQLPYFTTPHKLSIGKLCSQYGLNYLSCSEESKLEEQLKELYNPTETISILDLIFEEKSNLSAIDAFKNIRY